MRKETLFLILLFIPVFYSGQNAQFIISNGVYVNSNSNIDVDGSMENYGHLINHNEVFVNGDFFSENSYSGMGRLSLVSNGNHILCSDTIHDLLIANTTTEVNLDDDLFIRNELVLMDGKLNLTGATMHLNNNNYSQNLTILSSDSYAYNGQIRQNLSENGPYLFPLGSFNDYAPITISVDESNYQDRWIEVSIVENSHPDLPNSNDYLNLFWNVEKSSFNSDALFSIEAFYPDLLVIGDEINFKGEVYLNPGWLGTSSNADVQEGEDYHEPNINLLQLNNISELGDFMIYTRILGCEGDVNTDGAVNILDLVVVSSNFGCSPNCEGDANGDGQVNILDLVVVSSNFGNICQ